MIYDNDNCILAESFGWINESWQPINDGVFFWYNNGQSSFNFALYHKGIVSYKKVTKPITAIEDFAVSTISIYPNPTTGQLRIKNYELRENTVLKIYNIVGQVVFTSAVSPHSPETTIDISPLANGMYFLKINEKTVKFVKN